MPKWMPVGALLLLALGVLAAACGDDEEKDTSGAATSRSTTSASQAVEPTTVASPAVEPTAESSPAVKMEADDFYFEPAEIAAAAGKAITVEVDNEGDAPHTFTIDSLNVDQTISPGQELDITFTPTQAGDLAFYCKFHRASNGMEGIVKVSSAGGGAAPNTPAPTAVPGGFSGY